MKRSLLVPFVTSAAVMVSATSGAQTPPRRLPSAAGVAALGDAGTAPTPVPPPATATDPKPADATADKGTKKPAAAGAKATPGSNGKLSADTSNLPQFEQTMEYEPRNPNYRVSFSLEEADLAELVKVIGQLTGKRFIFGGKVRNIKATVFSPQKVTVAEAYQAFLAILEANGLTVVPHGRFLKIVETSGIATQGTPVYGSAQPVPAEARFVTRMHRLAHVGADEVASILGHFKSKEADITVYAPSNMLIITETGANIRRMMQLVEEIDVGGAGDQIWIEPVHYGAASELATRVNELFDLKGGSAPAGGKGGAPANASNSAGSDLHVAKVVADDRTNSLIIVATERAYLRILEFLKRIDVPQTGEGEIHVLPLQHADATELVKTLNEIVSGAAQAGGGAPAKTGGGAAPSGIFEGGVKVSADKSTNSIVITSSLRDYASMRAVVDKLDQARRQVFIEAVIMDLSIDRTGQFGINFHAGTTFPSADGDTLAYGGLNPLKTILLPGATDLQGMALGLRGPGIPGSQNLLGTGITVPAFGTMLNALATSSDKDVLSTPHIIATDNIAAEINVGENVPLQTNTGGVGSLGSAGGAAGAALAGLGGFGGFSAPRQDVGTKIKIIPHLNESNEVRLELTEEISEAGAPLPGSLGAIPITKRNANTQLVVRDQQTVVIGGLMRNRVVHGTSKIPLLGDIPVLGALFRATTDQMQKTNLVLVLTPYIIREQEDLRSVFERKMQERQEFLDRFFVFSDDTDYQPPKDYSRTNGLVEDIRQAYLVMEEKRRLDELTRPKDLKVHAPGQPLEMPAPVQQGAAGASGGNAPAPTEGGTPAAPPTPGDRRNRLSPAVTIPPGGAALTPPNLNVTPPARTVEKVEK
ncbi:MAG: type II secretion system secretin GspD [Polyangiaceae bacterium]